MALFDPAYRAGFLVAFCLFWSEMLEKFWKTMAITIFSYFITC